MNFFFMKGGSGTRCWPDAQATELDVLDVKNQDRLLYQHQSNLD